MNAALDRVLAWLMAWRPLESLRAYVRRFALWLLGWVDACPICAANWREHRCPYLPIATFRVCGVCQIALPVDALRSHDGQWRCAAHKGQA